MSKYSHVHGKKVLDFSYKKLSEGVYNFSIGHIFLGQLHKQCRGRWCAINWYGNKNSSAEGLSSRHDGAEYLIKLFVESQAGTKKKLDDMIVSNQVKCLSCKDEIYSMNRHDFKSCSCGSIAVDGGQDYLKRIGDLDNYEEQSIMFNQTDIRILTYDVTKSMESGRNPYGVTLAVMRGLRDLGYKVEKA